MNIKLSLRKKTIASLLRAARLSGKSISCYLNEIVVKQTKEDAMRQRWLFTMPHKKCVIKKHPHDGDCLDKRGESLWKEEFWK